MEEYAAFFYKKLRDLKYELAAYQRNLIAMEIAVEKCKKEIAETEKKIHDIDG